MSEEEEEGGGAKRTDSVRSSINPTQTLWISACVPSTHMFDVSARQTGNMMMIYHETTINLCIDLLLSVRMLVSTSDEGPLLVFAVSIATLMSSIHFSISARELERKKKKTHMKGSRAQHVASLVPAGDPPVVTNSPVDKKRPMLEGQRSGLPDLPLKHSKTPSAHSLRVDR